MTSFVKIPLLFLYCFIFLPSLQAKKVSIVSEKSLQNHAEILQKYLAEIYPSNTFYYTSVLPRDGDIIVLQINTDLKDEAFKIHSTEEINRVILHIAAGSRSGLYYAVYQLLESFGAGFFLSFETMPENREEMDLRKINITDKPLTRERIVFNWHNFLSGCSSWDFEDWKHYIDQSSKMRFNGLMTHFYANDPTFVFSHKGVKKIPGYMPNTQKGRQYGTQQVNDVRRLAGGDVFEDQVFGSNASKVADDQRVAEARGLMQKVHEYASSKFMDVWFGLDIDAQLANPQEIMATLPESSKMKIKQKSNKYFGTPDSTFYLPIPDSPGGYAYYKSQVTQLFKQFPEIDNIILWTRTSGSPFLTLKYEDFPVNWKLEFNQIAAVNHKIDKDNNSITGRFATAKIYKSVRRILNEMGKNDIKLWAGSWRTTWLEQADWFYPKEVGFIPLDYHVDYFLVEDKNEILKKISGNRKIIPVVWAHHDDGAFIGSPYKPYVNLHSKIESTGNSGVGVIHWTTKPLDIYFKNTQQQIWESTQNTSLNNTAIFLSKRLVKESNQKNFAQYLEDWVNEGPKFGRETRTWFIDHIISDTDYIETTEACKKRLKLLKNIREPENLQLAYFTGLEVFCIDFYHTQYNFQKALEACNSGDYSKAIQYIQKCHPEKVIQKYAETSKINGITKGEKGVIIEMNLSWLPFINSLRQTLAQQPAYYNFGTVNFPDMGVGLLNTNYFLDAESRLWRNFGETETGAKLVHHCPKNIISNKVLAEIASEGVQIEDSGEIKLEPFAVDISPQALKNPDFFMPGKYNLTLILSTKIQTDIQLMIIGAKTKKILFTGKIVTKTGQLISKTFPFQLYSEDALTVVLKNKKGSAIFNGAIVKPQKSKSQ